MVIRELCRMGFPLALQHVLIAVGGMILQSRINIQGFIFVAGFTATNKLYGLLESAAISLGYATTTYMAQNHGAGQNNRIRKGLKSVTLIALLMSVCSAVPAILGGKHLLKLLFHLQTAAHRKCSQSLTSTSSSWEGCFFLYCTFCTDFGYTSGTGRCGESDDIRSD